MPLVIPDDILAESRLTEAQARVEIACRFYAAGRLALPSAARLAGLDSSQFEGELTGRGIPIREDSEADADESYSRGYGRIPEDPADAVALAPHLPVPPERWE
jgi:predicted HTH domain antitoxin